MAGNLLQLTLVRFPLPSVKAESRDEFAPEYGAEKRAGSLLKLLLRRNQVTFALDHRLLFSEVALLSIKFMLK